MAMHCRNVAGTGAPSFWVDVPSARRSHAPCHSRSAITAHGVCLLRGFTLVEMLVAMAITLVMMAAVVTLFANVSNSVRNRRATIEMSGQLRHLRNVLQQDLQGATCPGLTWQRPESNHGYIELIEGQYREVTPSMLTDGNNDSDGDGKPDELDPALSIVPRNNVVLDYNSNGTVDDSDRAAHFDRAESLVGTSGLGDYDDILMLTVRNEHEPFVGRTPTDLDDDDSGDGDPAGFGGWEYETIESPLAEVVWFAIENPEAAANTDNFFGEPAMRTIYRRTLLIAPWVNPYKQVDDDGDGVVDIGGTTFKAVPGLLRLLPSNNFTQGDLDRVFAALIAFQDRYDLSVRAEWDPNIQHWKIVANTLGDLTKRENRFGHYGFFPGAGGNPPQRVYPYAAVSWGSGYGGGNVEAIVDPEIGGPGSDADIGANVPSDLVVSYTVTDPGAGYLTRPFVFVDEDSDTPATAQAILNDDGQVVRVIHGPVPLWGDGRNGTPARRGQDVLMSDVLAFDVRVYDPGAPLYMETSTQTVLQPADPGWRVAFDQDVPTVNDTIAGTTQFNFVGQGAYVDLGYGAGGNIPNNFFAPPVSGTIPWFIFPNVLSDVFGRALARGYTVYDTWSFHCENNGVDEDDDGLIDEGTDGLDGVGHYENPMPPPLTVNDTRLGVDDVGERETVPPYDKPLRGMQVLIRTYERDSRAIRQVRVNQHFMPE